MSDPSRLRDSTQIVVRRETLNELEPPIDEECTVTVFEESEDYYRIIGSPVEIKQAGEYLARRGVSVP
ncbi:VNG_1110C family protein [Natronobacterium gregoryi]|uniref:Uncharacterized protein n=2 Tax=Natronobacterium gregoryi TaxID=44930 RepID=L0AJ13_NATGS|nr:hypothetical protein [Natronobacterium gregoryi]AFZ73893.1 hypothetical protein Natgr_2748 [Natronobacterium gregoryi SP2]ELY64849.1 hypothetical protein C490_14225 [Natronobacterium gregoryi SP2]PLK19149.1 hypothetical protein CYV19_16380 [Natronobacterium gregoryi SP2]SFJ59601.1 hypothetical protein SAMN05443661_14414 [Natronobacterium gregoryi]